MKRDLMQSQWPHPGATDLAGVWDFAFLGDVNADRVNVGKLTFTDRMAVPGCFDAMPNYAGRRGLAAYRTFASFADRRRHRLILDGVHHWCRVFVDGRAIGDHVGGFTRFAMDFTPRRAGLAEIVVLVDNRLDYARCPLHLEYFDWYHYGGIARGAAVRPLGRCWIDAVRFVTEDYASRRLSVRIDYGAAAAGPVRLELELAGRRLRRTVRLSSPGGSLTVRLSVPRAALWSPREPNLHELRLTLGQDAYRCRVGIRQVQVAGRDILINGRAVRLLGVNRHENHPQFGHALPPGLLLADAQQIRDLGCNFVRGCHYPQDERFLDLCDEMGICVWSESIGWQHTAEHLTDERFMQAQLANVQEMVAAAASHPSVVMWGVLNESRSDDPLGRAGYERLLGRLRELDPTRPVTYATNRPMKDLCYDLADVISINAYPGWYEGQLEDIPERLDMLAAHLDNVGQGHKPLIISEIGAGAIPGWRDAHATRWSEQYQARLLEIVIRHLFIERRRACGLAIWQFADGRTSEQVSRILGRPRGFNNKGLVDEYRRPKLAYEAVKSLFIALQAGFAK